jgi:serine protease Do
VKLMNSRLSSLPTEALRLSIRRRLALLGTLSFLLCGTVCAQTVDRQVTSNPLLQMNESFRELVARVTPGIVQIIVTGYRPLGEESGGRAGLVIGKERSIGSGVIVDPSGYIITNNHVVEGAQRVRVALTSPSQEASPLQLVTRRGSVLNATLVGVFKEADLALLKVDDGSGQRGCSPAES